MIKSEDIPADIWATAYRVWAEMLTVSHRVLDFKTKRDVEEIAEVILEERERCALIAEYEIGTSADGDSEIEEECSYVARKISYAIREGKAPKE